MALIDRKKPAISARPATTRGQDGQRSAANGGGAPVVWDVPVDQESHVVWDGPVDQESHGGALLLSDFETTVSLLNYGRRAAIARLFGLNGQDANIATFIGLLLLAQATRERVQRMARASTPSGSDALLGLASAREVVFSVAGPSSRDTPGLGMLIIIAVLGASAGPAISRSLRGMRGASHRMSGGFHHRYGYLVDPGHWRRRRAQMRAALAQRQEPVVKP